jgi:hypothetical protein
MGYLEGSRGSGALASREYDRQEQHESAWRSWNRYKAYATRSTPTRRTSGARASALLDESRR